MSTVGPASRQPRRSPEYSRTLRHRRSPAHPRRSRGAPRPRSDRRDLVPPAQPPVDPDPGSPDADASARWRGVDRGLPSVARRRMIAMGKLGMHPRKLGKLNNHDQEPWKAPLPQWAAAAKRILFLPHAVRQVSRPSQMISPTEIVAAIAVGELVEDYPEDARGPSCLLLGSGDGGLPIHIVCPPKPDSLASSWPISLVPISGLPISRRGVDHAVHAL